jgi:hypothetical protein
MSGWEKAALCVGVLGLIVQGLLWSRCDNRGGEFVKAPFEIGYHCTK